MTEKQLEKAIIEYIRWIGGYVQKVQSGVIPQAYMTKSGDRTTRWIHLADKGTPDLFACIEGEFLGIEVKKSDREVVRWAKGANPHSQAQMRQHRLIRQAKGITMIVGSIDALEKDLEQLNLLPKKSQHGKKSKAT